MDIFRFLLLLALGVTCSCLVNADSSTSLYIYSFGLAGNEYYNVSIIDVSNAETLKSFNIPNYDILGIANDENNNLVILGQQLNGTYTFSKLMYGSNELTVISSLNALPKTFAYLTSSFAYYPTLGNTAVLLGLLGKEKVAIVQFNFTDSTLKLIYLNMTQSDDPIASGSGDSYYIQYQDASGKQVLVVYSMVQHRVVGTYTIGGMPQSFIQLFLYGPENVYGLVANPGVIQVYYMNLTNMSSGSKVVASKLIQLEDIVWNYYMNFLLNNEQYLTIFTYPTQQQMTVTTIDLSTQATMSTLNSTNVDWNNNPLAYLIINRQQP